MSESSKISHNMSSKQSYKDSVAYREIVGLYCGSGLQMRVCKLVSETRKYGPSVICEGNDNLVGSRNVYVDLI